MRTFILTMAMFGILLALPGCGGTTVCTERDYTRTAYYNPDDYTSYETVAYDANPVAEARELPPVSAPTPSTYDPAPPVAVETTVVSRANVLTCDPCAGL